MAYVTLTDFKAYLEASRTGVSNDQRLQAALDAAHAAIDDHLGRAMVVATGSTTRLYAPDDDLLLNINDATAVTVVAESGVTLAATAYQLEPLNGRNIAGTVTPYNMIRRLGGCWYAGPTFGQATISVTATFGWAAIPAPVVESCKILAKDIALTRELRGDVAGFDDFGAVRIRQNAQLAGMLQPYRRTAQSAFVSVI